MDPKNKLPPGFKMTELGPLPEEWQVVRLGDVVETVKGKKPKILLEEWKDGVLPYLTAEYFRDKIISKYVQIGSENDYVNVDEDDVIFIWDGSNAGDVFLGTKGVLASTMVKIIPKEKIIRRFLFYFLKTQFQLFNEKTTGSTIPHINKNLYQNLPIPLPPLPEQKKIAAVLSAVQEAKEKTEGVIRATKELKKSLMKHLFTYGPVPVKEIENVKLKETEIGQIPEHWQVVRLGDVAETTSGGTPSRKVPEFFGGTIPWVKSGELNDTLVTKTEETITEDGLRNSNAKIFQKGTLLIAMYGATAGKVGILAIPATTNQAICAILPDTSFALQDFLFYTLIRQRETLLSKRYGGAQPNLNQTIIRSFPIPFPPLPEQQKIAEMLSAVDEKIRAEESKKKALEVLFKTLLHDLMTAKVRVHNLNIHGVT